MKQVYIHFLLINNIYFTQNPCAGWSFLENSPSCNRASQQSPLLFYTVLPKGLSSTLFLKHTKAFLPLDLFMVQPSSSKTFSPTFYIDPSPTKPIYINLCIPVRLVYDSVSLSLSGLSSYIRVKSNKDNLNFLYLKVHFTACCALDRTVAEQRSITFRKKMKQL